jgi:hypothetical protein
MAHKVGCGPIKSPDRVRIYVSYNRVEKCLYLYGGSPDNKNSSLNSIERMRTIG